MDIHEHVKSGDQIEYATTIIHQMGKFPPQFLEFTEMPPTAFAFASSSTTENPNLTFPSPNLQYSAVLFNNAADSTAPPCFLPCSAPRRWRSHVSATATADTKEKSMVAMREMMYRIAAMQPVHIDPESVKPPKRRNVKISKDPQSVAARLRRERISQRIRILQRIVPGGTKMDTASMLDEAIHYVNFLKNQLHSLQIATAAANRHVGHRFSAAGIHHKDHYFRQDHVDE